MEGISVTLIIIVITGFVSFQCFNKRDLFYKLLFSPYQVKHRREWYRFFTHALVHAHWPHLLVNMWVLYIFGSGLEARFITHFGTAKGLIFYVALYVGGFLFSSLPALQKHGDNAGYNAVGASGAVSAILYSAIVMTPLTGIGLLFVPGIYIPAFIFGILYLAYEWYMDKRSRDNVAHDAHFWGAVFGVIFTLCLDPDLAVDFVEQIKYYFS